MTRRRYHDLLEARWDHGCFVCVGLDPDWSRVPPLVKARAEAQHGAARSARARATVDFCSAIAAATFDYACAFKPNAAFFEAIGDDGHWALGEVIARLHDLAPDVPVIYDAKRGDIGSTNLGYVEDAFDRLGADAITVHPYLGEEALKPFLDRADRGTIVLCRTSNPGGGELQDLRVGGRPLYQTVAERVVGHWNRQGNCSLVVGATYPEELADVRRIAPDVPILIPGIGAQGGDLHRTVLAGRDRRGRGMVINASRAIIFASGAEDFAQAARRETLKLHDEINRCRTGA